LATAGFLCAAILLLAPCAFSQSTDVSFNAFGRFNGSSTGNGATQSQDSAPGFMFGVRHYQNPLLGYEATYSYSPANQNLSGFTEDANQQTVAADYVVSLPLAKTNLRPFALGGAAASVFHPTNGYGGNSTTQLSFVYGAGLDVNFAKRVGLRLQYRGLVTKAPDFGSAFLSTNSFFNQGDAMIGIYFKL
jgi:opacity protein-like surface antigen